MGLDISPSVLVAALMLLLAWVLMSMWNRNKDLPPGPWGLPFFGYYPFINKTDQDLLRMGQEYGSVSSFRTLGGRLFVVLNGAKTIKEILITRADEFVGRDSGSSLVNSLSNSIGIAQEEGDAWKEQRRFWLQSVKNLGFGRQQTESLVQEEIRELLEAFRAQGGRSFDAHFPLAQATCSVICHVLFGKRIEKGLALREIIDHFQNIINGFVGKNHFLVGYIYDVMMKLTSKLQEFKKSNKDITKFINKMIDEQIKGLDPEHPRGYVDTFLVARQELLDRGNKDAGTYTMQRLSGITLNMFFEGTESTSGTIHALLQKLSRHRDVQREVQVELDAVVGRAHLPAWSDRPQLPYLDAAIQELYRTTGLFLVSTVYQNFEETTIHGFKIPKRSFIVSNMLSIHHDQTIYPNPEKFDPRRYLNDEGKRIKREGPYPFGLGKRACVGESIAHMEVFLFIAAILQNFTILPGDNNDSLKMIPRE